MEQLPDLALMAIFGHLGVRSLATCRLVSKQIKSCVDRWARPKHLVLNEMVTDEDKWRYRDDLIDPDCKINGYDTDVLNKIPFDLRRLQRLKISNYALYQELGDMIRFIGETANQLEHLEIVGFFVRENSSLCLPRLRVLFIDWPENSGMITVDAPALQVLSFFGTRGSLSLINVVHPTSVRHLELFNRAMEEIEQFENVETLRVFLPRNIDRHLLRSNPRLKEVYFLGNSEWDLLEVDVTRRIVNRLLEEKQELAKSDLKIHFFDQLLDDDRRFDDYQFPRRYNEFFYFESDEDEGFA